MIRGRQYDGAKETQAYKRAYAMLGNENLENLYGLKLKSYSIGSPYILTNYIDVPGRAGKLDATLALNGKVNYTVRSVSAQFHVSNLRHDAYTELLEKLYKRYHGTENKLAFSFDPDWYYKGRFEVSGTKENDISADIEFTSDNVFPYKLEQTTVSASVSISTSVTLLGKAYNSALTINASTASMTVTFAGTTYTLVKGDNLVPELHLSEGDNVLTFQGLGTVRVTYERGVL